MLEADATLQIARDDAYIQCVEPGVELGADLVEVRIIRVRAYVEP